MAQVINTNSLSLLTQNNLNKSQASLGSAIERLSSGLRINSAKDDAAGMAIANRFTANIRGLSQASRNANDGISVAQTTEGALSEINNNLQRVRELSVQASSGSNSGSDLASIQAEISQRLDEINRVSAQTDFNGRKVLSEDSQMSIQVGARDGEAITVDLKKTDSNTLKLSNLDVTKVATTVADGTMVNSPNYIPLSNWVKPGSNDFIDTNTLNPVNPSNNFTLEYDTANPGALLVNDGKNNYYAATVDNTTGKVTFDSSSAKVSVGVTRGASIGKDVPLDTSSLLQGESVISYRDSSGTTQYAIKEASGTYKTVDFDSRTGKTYKNQITVTPDITVDPLKKIDAALSDVDQLRSSLGAAQNRFESAISNLGNSVNNQTAARSRIEDSDYATEVSNMSRAQILQQAGTSVLAQANQSTQNVLSLLR